MGKAIGIGGVFIHFNGDSKELFDFYLIVSENSLFKELSGR